MWYLQSETLILISGLSLVLGIIRRIIPNAARYIMPFAQLAALWFISKRLALFMAAYILMGIFCCFILSKMQNGVLFAIFSFGALIPLFASRVEVFGLTLPVLFVSIGIAFHVLRMIDAFYYAYYSGENVRPAVFINYMLLIPVFTAGPIFRYRDFQNSFDNPLKLDGKEFTIVFKRLIRGLFKKVVAAALLLEVFTWVTTQSKWYFSLIAICLSYMILYLDFSGYSDIAIVFGRIMGFDVPENFKSPWRAATFTQFWRSWHSTLSDWIREHIYIVIGKHKPGKIVSSIIALFTMIIMSLWHGFNIAFLISGVYNGLLLALENLFSLTTLPRKSNSAVVLLRRVTVNALFAVSTLVFMLPWDGVVRVLRGLMEG